MSQPAFDFGETELDDVTNPTYGVGELADAINDTLRRGFSDGVWVRGGLGGVPGAVLGGLIIGLAEALVPSELSGYKDAVAFGFLFLMLLVRPQGLLGKPLPNKV